MVVHHYNREGRVKDSDFSTLPVAAPMQRSLAALFAARCTPHYWTVHMTSKQHWFRMTQFTTYLSQLDRPPRDLDEVTAELVRHWRESLAGTADGYSTFDTIARLLRSDTRLQAGLVADELATRLRQPNSTVQSYSEAEFEQITVAARRTFRTALGRIEENIGHLAAWRQGTFAEGSRDWMLGEALEVMARGEALPCYVDKNGRRSLQGKYRRALGGVRWKRLFLSRTEAAALGVLLLAEFGWNLSVIDRLEVPRASPDPGEDGRPTYRVPLEKPRRGAGQHHETRNITDHGATSPGRLITQALRATAPARAIVENLAPDTNRLIIWRQEYGRQQRVDQADRHAAVGPFHFGVAVDAATRWARAEGFTGSPFRKGRRTVVALDRREPTQHSQDTHDRHYVLVDKRVQAQAVEVIAAGAEDAADRARTAVLVAVLRDRHSPGDVETATADCSDFDNGPVPTSAGCGASFLMCLACTNARVHPGHHPQLAHLHSALTNLRSVLSPAVWNADWDDTHARLTDLQDKLGDGLWAQTLAQVTDADRDLADHLLTGALDA